MVVVICGCCNACFPPRKLQTMIPKRWEHASSNNIIPGTARSCTASGATCVFLTRTVQRRTPPPRTGFLFARVFFSFLLEWVCLLEQRVLTTRLFSTIHWFFCSSGAPWDSHDAPKNNNIHKTKEDNKTTTIKQHHHHHQQTTHKQQTTNNKQRTTNNTTNKRASKQTTTTNKQTNKQRTKQNKQQTTNNQQPVVILAQVTVPARWQVLDDGSESLASTVCRARRAALDGRVIKVKLVWEVQCYILEAVGDAMAATRAIRQLIQGGFDLTDADTVAIEVQVLG